MSGDALPILVGAVIAIVLIRWLFQNKDDPRGIGGPPREALEQLTTMFPNIPPSVLRAELIRAGSVASAIERLLVISPQYHVVRPREATDEKSLTPKNKLIELLHDLEGDQMGLETSSTPLKVDAETWNLDRTAREQLLVQKKREMLIKARRKFSEKNTL